MNPKSLPDVTVVIIDNVEPRLTQKALSRTLQQIHPAEVHVWSGQEFPFYGSPAPLQLFHAEPNNLDAVAEILWYEVPKCVKTSHMLLIQWDGWVLDGKRWTDEFLSYDYIGAPWPWHPNKRIGNGGFSLRSTRLMRSLSSFDIIGPEDDCLCRRYRPYLEAHSFSWAPEDLAARFSFEHGPKEPTFGFHGAFNLPSVLPQEEFSELVSIAGKHASSTNAWKRMLGVANA